MRGTRIYLAILIILYSIVISYCERETENFWTCNSEGYKSIPIQQIGEKLVKDTIDCWLKRYDTSFIYSANYRIDDQQLFERLVDCNCEVPRFNFRDYTLLMGYIYIGKGIGTVGKQTVTYYCSYFSYFEGHIMYQVVIDVEPIDTFNTTFVYYHAIIPKLPQDLEVQYAVFKNKL
jgi:hypothetical protein